MSSRLPGMRPPHSAKSIIEARLPAASLSSKLRASTVGGLALSGMSMQVVTPPGRERARAEREALPVRAAGVVEVHVRIDPAREHVQPARVDLLGRRLRRSPRRSRR